MDELTKPRSIIYTLLGSLYVNGVLKRDYDSVALVIKQLLNNPFMEEIKKPLSLMLEKLSDKNAVLYEYEELFNLPFGDFINSSVSFYNDERELGEQTIVAKEIMCEAGYIKSDEFSAGEDEFGLLCVLCARLLKDGETKLQKRVFHELLLPHISGFIDAQLRSERANFYKSSAEFFALFMAFEKSYFEIHG